MTKKPNIYGTIIRNPLSLNISFQFLRFMEKHTAMPEIMNKSGIRQILIKAIINHNISSVCLFCGKNSFIPKGIKLIVA